MSAAGKTLLWGLGGVLFLFAVYLLSRGPGARPQKDRAHEAAAYEEICQTALLSSQVNAMRLRQAEDRVAEMEALLQSCTRRLEENPLTCE